MSDQEEEALKQMDKFLTDSGYLYPKTLERARTTWTQEEAFSKERFGPATTTHTEGWQKVP